MQDSRFLAGICGDQSRCRGPARHPGLHMVQLQRYVRIVSVTIAMCMYVEVMRDIYDNAQNAAIHVRDMI